jgi:hypothetical protein
MKLMRFPQKITGIEHESKDGIQQRHPWRHPRVC